MSSLVQAKWMNSLTAQLRQFGHLLLEQVLDRLDVVVGGALDLFDALGMFEGEVCCQGIEESVGFGGERRDFSDLLRWRPGVAASVLPPGRGNGSGHIR